MSESQKPRFLPNARTAEEIERNKRRDKERRAVKRPGMDLFLDDEGKTRTGPPPLPQRIAPPPLPEPEEPRQLAPNHDFVWWLIGMIIGGPILFLVV